MLRNLLATLGILLACGGCKAVQPPSNSRLWSPDLTVLPYVEVHDDLVTVHNIRDCQYYDEDAYVLDWYDRVYDLGLLETVDFILDPFAGMPSVAHTMMSFGFSNGDHLCVSVEIRREKGEEYSAAKGFLRQYELIYLLGDERDVIRLRTTYRKDNVYMYRLRVTPEQARIMFLDVVRRINRLNTQPEYYNTLTNNCTTNLVAHINHAIPGKVPFHDLRVLFPGFSDELLYDVGLIDSNFPFEETRRRALISIPAAQGQEGEDFSERIRQ